MMSGATKLNALQFPAESFKIKCAQKLIAILDTDYRVIDGKQRLRAKSGFESSGSA